MRKLRTYYIYFVAVVVLTSFLIFFIIIDIFLNHGKLLALFLSLIDFDCLLWLVVIIKKPSLKEITKIIKAENDKNDSIKPEIKKQLEVIMQQVDQCQEDANDLQRHYEKHKNELSNEETN